MLRPIYHCLLDKYNFQESDHGKPWYQQSLVRAVLENEKAKIDWNHDVPFILEKPPKMELISLTLLYMIKKPTSGLYLKAQSAK